MADIEIICPECGNQRAVPSDLVGKKIKCKKCQSIFIVKAPKPGEAPAKTAGRPKAGSVGRKADEEDDKNPYTMRDMDLSIRCPHCAMPMEPQDAKVCIHCGYHMQKRKRVESKKVYETTAADYLLWHLSTAACFVAIGMVVGFAVFCILNFPDWIAGAWFEDVLPVGCWQTWCAIFSLFLIFLAGRFIFRKLVWRIHPPEKERKPVHDEEEV